MASLVTVAAAAVMVVVLVMGKGSYAQIPTEQDKYNYLKVMTGCLGSRTVIGWRRQMVVAMEKCVGTQVATPPTLDLTQYLESLGVTTPVNPAFIQFPVYQAGHAPEPARTPQFTQVAPQNAQYFQPYYFSNNLQYYQPEQFNLANQYLKGWLSLRARRGAETEAAATELKEALAQRLSNITCILREVKLLDDNDQVNYDHVRQELLSAVAGQLREELSTAEGSCRAFSRCVPPHGPAAHPLARHLGPAIVYYRCMAQKKMAACMRQDLRKIGAEIGWQGGDNPLTTLLETPVLKQVEDLMLGDSGIPELLI
ncbi:uncharacterized protein LOC135102102 [Scylla paramamosain]|uniref:uncharacterized protein LOC135102102 n=1 Tax=Scylla paramamosain TaxID=85552 RepID=UPI0030831317